MIWGLLNGDCDRIMLIEPCSDLFL